MWMVVRILAGDITNLHYNFVVAKPLVIIIIIIYLTEKIHSKQNTLYALSVKNVISQEMEKR